MGSTPTVCMNGGKAFMAGCNRLLTDRAEFESLCPYNNAEQEYYEYKKRRAVPRVRNGNTCN